MKKCGIFTLLVFSLFSLFTAINLTSCENFFESPFKEVVENSHKSKNTFTIGGSLNSTVTYPSSPTAVSSLVNSERTAVPTLSGTGNYKVSATGTTSNTVIGTVTTDGSDVSYSLTLTNDTWTITAELYNSYDSETSTYSGLMLSGSTTITIDAEGVVTDSDSNTIETIPITIRPGTSAGNGTVSLPVAVASDSGIIQVAAKWGTSTQTLDFSSNKSGTFTMIPDGETATSVEPDAYSVTFCFYAGTSTDKSLVYSFTEVVNVYSNLCTNTWKTYGSCSYVNGSGTDATISVTSTMVWAYASGYYVSNTGSDEADSTGSKMSPFATVQHAYNIIAAKNDGTSYYTINVMNDLTATASTVVDASDSTKTFINIAPSKALNLTIKSADGSVYNLDANGSTTSARVMYIGENAAVTLKNINVCNGNITGLGAGIYMNGGALTLSDGSSVKNNAGSLDGGISCEKGTVTVGEGVTISGNKGSYGGGIYLNGYYGTVTLNLNGGTVSGNTADEGSGIWVGATRTGYSDYQAVINLAGNAYADKIMLSGNKGASTAECINITEVLTSTTAAATPMEISFDSTYSSTLFTTGTQILSGTDSYKLAGTDIEKFTLADTTTYKIDADGKLALKSSGGSGESKEITTWEELVSAVKAANTAGYTETTEFIIAATILTANSTLINKVPIKLVPKDSAVTIGRSTSFISGSIFNPQSELDIEGTDSYKFTLYSSTGGVTAPFICVNNSAAILNLDYVDMTNCIASCNGPAIQITENAGKCTIKNGKYTSNTDNSCADPVYYGGAIYVATESEVLIDSCTFGESDGNPNISTYGAAIAAVKAGNLTISNSTIKNNNSLGDKAYSGGGLYISDSKVVLDSDTFTDNKYQYNPKCDIGIDSTSTLTLKGKNTIDLLYYQFGTFDTSADYPATPIVIGDDITGSTINLQLSNVDSSTYTYSSYPLLTPATGVTDEQLNTAAGCFTIANSTSETTYSIAVKNSKGYLSDGSDSGSGSGDGGSSGGTGLTDVSSVTALSDVDTTDVTKFTAGTYKITTYEEMCALQTLSQSSNLAGYTFILGNDIDLKTTTWPGIGTTSTSFAGTFDGNGYTVKNLSQSSGDTGLFNYAGSDSGTATIKNLTVEGTKTSGNSIAGFVGDVSSGKTLLIDNCINKVTIEVDSYRYIGGFVGYLGGNVTIINSVNNANITTTKPGANTAGFVGYVVGTCNVYNCINNGAVKNSNTGSSAGNIGGIVGNYSSGSILINNCINTGVITAKSAFGAICGSSNSTVNYCYYLSGSSTCAKNNTEAGEAETAIYCSPFTTSSSASTLSNSITVGSTGYTDAVAALNAWINSSTLNTTSYTFNTWTYDSSGYPSFGTTNNAGSGGSGSGSYESLVDSSTIASGSYLAAGSYGITSEDDFTKFAALVNDGKLSDSEEYTFTLTTDIDMSKVTMTNGKIGSGSSLYFAHTFDGNNKKITNFEITSTSSNYNALFAFAKSATIKNVVMVDPNISVSKSYTAALCAYAGNGTLIENCHITTTDNSGKIESSSTIIGGIIANCINTIVNNCSNAVAVTCSSTTSGAPGGIVGSVSSNTVVIMNCCNTGKITGINPGGIVGLNTGSILNCYNAGEVCYSYSGSGGTETIGGIAGRCATTSSTGRIYNCVNEGKLTYSNASSKWARIIASADSTCTPKVYNSYGFDSTYFTSVTNLLEYSILVGDASDLSSDEVEEYNKWSCYTMSAADTFTDTSSTISLYGFTRASSSNVITENTTALSTASSSSGVSSVLNAWITAVGGSFTPYDSTTSADGTAIPYKTWTSGSSGPVFAN